MMKRYIKILGLFFIFLLSGCNEKIEVNSEVFNASPELCWPCRMYMQAFKAVDAVLDASLESIAANSLIILEIGFMFWLLLKVVSLGASFSKPDLKKEIATFVTVSFKVMVVVLFLNNPSYLYDFFGKVVLQPLGEGFLSLSETVLQAPRESGILNINSATYNLFIEQLRNIWNLFNGITDSSETVSNSRMFGPLALRLYEIVYQIFNSLWHGVGLGFQLLILNDWSAFCAAILLIGGMCWLLLMIPLYFIDAIMRIGLIMMLMPLLMVGWAFSFPEEPKKLLEKVLQGFLGAFFDILFNCIFITFAVSLFRIYENQKFQNMFSDAFHTTEGGLRRSAREFGTDFLIITVLAWAVLILSGKVQNFSSFFFKGSGGGSFLGIANHFKNLLVKTVRIGISAVTTLTGLGLAKTAAEGAANAAKGAAAGAVNVANGNGSGGGTGGESGSNERGKNGTEYKFGSDGQERKSTWSSSDGKEGTSQKSSKQSKAPKPKKAGNK